MRGNSNQSFYKFLINLHFLDENWTFAPVCHFTFFRFSLFFLGIALATYFLRLQIIILMRGKRSINQEINLPKIVTDLADTYETYTSDFSTLYS